ncbi:MAG: PD40 domain-containing protein [Chloroflexi bacterium]|nr:PD40 domain-containing protein [Chloroflexota bacterium]
MINTRYSRVFIGLLLVTFFFTWVATPSQSQSPTYIRIESDSSQVTHEGDWVNQNAEGASGGSYLYNTPAVGSNRDSFLQMQFSGTIVEIFYVSGPSLGTLAIEIDGTVVRTVITTTEKTSYGQSAKIDYLSDETHILKVYAQGGGTVGVDAFAILNDIDGTSQPSVVGREARSACDSITPTQRASEATDGTEGSSESYQPAISDNGRYIAFTTGNAFVASDTNNLQDVYVRDRVSCTTMRVSLSTSGQQAPSSSADAPDISGDGRYIVFRSDYGGFVAGDGNASLDIFRRDLQTNTTIRVSMTDTEGEGNGPSYSPAVSGDGRYITFASQATNLVTGDTNGVADVFVRDVTNGTTILISVTTSGGASPALSGTPSISNDGRYVTFITNAALDPVADTNGQTDVYVRDIVGNTTTLVSIGTSGFSANGVSDNPMIAGSGQFVAFHSVAADLVASDTNGQGDVFVRDTVNNTTMRVSLNSAGTQGSAESDDPSISNDGRYVTFFSDAANLIGDDSNVLRDVFVRDTLNNTTFRTSLTYQGLQATGYSDSPAISGDGSVVAYHSRAANLMATSDTNNTEDIYISNRAMVAAPTNLGTTTISQTQVDLNWIDNSSDETNFRIERSNDGTTGWAEIGTAVADAITYSDTTLSCGQTRYYRVRSYRSSDGAFSGYTAVVTGASVLCALSTPTNLNVFVGDMDWLALTWTDNSAGESTYLVERSPDGTNNWAQIATIAANSQSFASRLLMCNTPYHYRVRAFRQADSTYSSYSNVASNTTAPCPATCTNDPKAYRASKNASSVAGNEGSGDPDISDDGRYVVFQSYATNLVLSDTNTQSDIFLKDVLTCQIWRVSVASDGAQANGASYFPDISPNGRYIGFISTASNLTAGDTNNNYDAFVVDRLLGQITLLASYNGVVPTGGSTGGIVADNGIAAFYAVGTFAGLGPLQYALVRDLNSGTITIASYNEASQAVAAGGELSISPDGRYLAFTSSSGLVGGDTNGYGDVYLRDRQANTTTWVSVGHLGQQGLGNSMLPSVSSNGRYVSFESDAVNLVPNDTNTYRDIFLRDVQQNTTIRASASATGVQSNNASSNSVVDNNGVVYYSSSATTIIPGTSAGENQIYRYDSLNQQVTIVSRGSSGALGNGSSFSPNISSNGRYLAFESTAYNLDLTDVAGAYPDAFGLDMVVLGAPGNFTVIGNSSTSILLNWTEANLDETNHRIERSANGTTGWSEIATVGANVTTYTDTPLAVGATFYYRVRAYRVSDLSFSGYTPVLMARTAPNAPSNVQAGAVATRQVYVRWTDNSSDEDGWEVQRSPDGVNNWNILYVVQGGNFFTDTSLDLACGQVYYYRVRGYRNSDGARSAYSAADIGGTLGCGADTLALFRSSLNATSQINTLTQPPAAGNYISYTVVPPAAGTGGQWVMGDWDGDGLKTPGVYANNGVFYVTNQNGSTGSTWIATWIGLIGRPPVVGRFSASAANDCLGAVDSANFPPYGTAFALYFTCDLSGGAPALAFQWLSVVLPDSSGATGTHQFAAGDFNGDQVDSIAIRRGPFVAWTNVPPTTLLSEFSLAQYFGVPSPNDHTEGLFVVGDWSVNDAQSIDFFGLVYQNGYFYYRTNLSWNTLYYSFQGIGQPIGSPITVTSWRQR